MSDKFQRIRLGASDVKEHLTRQEYFLKGVSTFLIIGGFLLIGWSVWVPIKNFWVLQNNEPPPPPPIFDAPNESVAMNAPLSLADSPLLVVEDGTPTAEQLAAIDITDMTTTPEASPTPEISASSVSGADDSSLAGNPLPVVVEVITATPTETATPTQIPTETPTLTATSTPTPAPSPTSTASATPRALIRSLSRITGFDGEAQVVLKAGTPAPTVSNLNTDDIDPNLIAQIPETRSTATPLPTPTNTSTPLPTFTSTATPRPTLTATSTPRPTFTPWPTATATPNPFPPAQLPPTRIVAPAIDLDSDVVTVGWSRRDISGQEVSVWDVAEFAAGWHKNSALPGHQGNVVLSGHHNILGEVFRRTVDLEPNDIVTLYIGDRPYIYKVEDKFIVKDKGEPEEVRRANARWIGQFPDQRLTMITCWPYNNNSHRVVVIAKPFF